MSGKRAAVTGSTEAPPLCGSSASPPLCGGNSVRQTGKGLLALGEAVIKNNYSHVWASPGKSCLCPMACEPHSGEGQVGGGYFNPARGCISKAHSWAHTY